MSLSAQLRRDRISPLMSKESRPLMMEPQSQALGLQLHDNKFGSKQEVTGYYNAIHSPYNDASMIYNKCAVRLEKSTWSLIKENSEWSDFLNNGQSYRLHILGVVSMARSWD